MICVSNIWTREKGFNDILMLRQQLSEDELIVVIGVTEEQKSILPKGIIGIERTSNLENMAILYSGAHALINPTWGDTFGMVNIESLACGTPVITYNTGGAPESIDEKTGIVIHKGDITGINDSIGKAIHLRPIDCRERVIKNFSRKIKYQEYLDLYNTFLSQN